MSLLQQFTNSNYLTEEDTSALTFDTVKDLEKSVRKGVENSGKWSNALELVHKAYEINKVQRPTPDMPSAWKQYETLITYAVQQLSKTHGINGTWRMTSESFDAKDNFLIEYNIGGTLTEVRMNANSIQEIAEHFENGLDNVQTVLNEYDDYAVVELWEQGVVKSKHSLKITKI